MITTNCLICGKEFQARKVDLKRGWSKYCGNKCKGAAKTAQYQAKLIIKPCPVCGTPFKTTPTPTKNGPTTCGSLKCTKTRVLSVEAKQAISSKLSKYIKTDAGYKVKCIKCGSYHYTKSHRTKYCDNCRPSGKTICKCGKPVSYMLECTDCHKRSSSLGGKKTISLQITSSKYEQILSDHLINYNPIRNDKTLLDGFEVDILFNDHKLACEYRGPWHYRNIMANGTLGSTANRDRIKEKMLLEKGWKIYPVSWALTRHDTPDRILQESSLLSETLNAIAGEATPFYFEYDRNKFLSQYSQLVKSEPSLNGFMHCRDIIEFYHKHIWFMKTSRHKITPFEFWRDNSQKVIDNRIKYADLTPRALRRYFKIIDMVPSTFQDSHAKLMASQISGNFIVDPFTGFGGRALGACAAGKTYLGIDSNPITINSNKVMAFDIGLNAKFNRADSSKIDPIECDGMITSPPFYNKDNYNSEFESVAHYLDVMNKSFQNIRFSELGIIDFKPVEGCTLQQFCGMLPYDITNVLQVDFGGINRHSIHYWIYCVPST